jgi:hypothetical protein
VGGVLPRLRVRGGEIAARGAISPEAVFMGMAMNGARIGGGASDRRTDIDIGRIVAALEEKLGQYPGEEDLVNAKEWL